MAITWKDVDAWLAENEAVANPVRQERNLPSSPMLIAPEEMPGTGRVPTFKEQAIAKAQYQELDSEGQFDAWLAQNQPKAEPDFDTWLAENEDPKKWKTYLAQDEVIDPIAPAYKDQFTMQDFSGMGQSYQKSNAPTMGGIGERADIPFIDTAANVVGQGAAGVASGFLDMSALLGAGTPELMAENKVNALQQRIEQARFAYDQEAGLRARGDVGGKSTTLGGGSLSADTDLAKGIARSGGYKPADTVQTQRLLNVVQELEAQQKAELDKAKDWRMIREDLQKSAQSGWLEPKEDMTVPEWMARTIGAAIPAAASAYALAPVSPVAGALLLGHVQGMGSYFEARQNKISIEEAQRIYALESILSTAIEYLPLERLTKLKGGPVRRFITQGATEGAEEVLDTIKSNMIAKGNWDENRSLWEGWKEALVGGAGVGAPMGVISGGSGISPEAEQISQAPQTLTAPAPGTAENPLSADTPITVDNGIVNVQQEVPDFMAGDEVIEPQPISAERLTAQPISTKTPALEAQKPLAERAKEFKTAKEFGASLKNAEATLQPSNKTDAPYEGSFIEGEHYIDQYGDNPYVYESRMVNPDDLIVNLNLEGRTYEQVVAMPSTQKYIEWYKDGKQPPPIDVVITDKKRMRSTNRRRVVAAIEAGVAEIPALVEIGRRDDIFNSTEAPAPEAKAKEKVIPVEAKQAGEKVDEKPDTVKSDLNVDGKIINPTIQHSAPASEFTDKLFRQTDPDRAINLLDSRASGDLNEELFFSNKKELALGQKENTGVLIEIKAPSDMSVRINKNLPGWQFHLDSGSAEFVAPFATRKNVQDNILSYTIEKDAKMSKLNKRILANINRDHLADGWTKTENADGSTTYSQPISAERLTAQPPAAPAQEAVTEQGTQSIQGAAPSQVKSWQELAPGKTAEAIAAKKQAKAEEPVDLIAGTVATAVNPQTSSGREIKDIRETMEKSQLAGEMKNLAIELDGIEQYTAAGGAYGKQAVADDKGYIIGWKNMGSIYPEGFSAGDASVINKFLEGKKLTAKQADIVEKAFDKVEGDLKALGDVISVDDLQVGSTFKMDRRVFRVIGETDTSLQIEGPNNAKINLPFEDTKGLRVDSGSLKAAEAPKQEGLKPDQAQLFGEDEGGFQLTGEKAVDTFKIAEDKAKAEKAKAEVDKRQGDLFAEAKKPTKGVGAAAADSTKEFVGTGTGASKAYTETMRKRLGMQPSPKHEVIHDEQLIAETELAYAKDKNAGRDLMDAFDADPRRGPNSLETMILIREAVITEEAVNEARATTNSEVTIVAAEARLEKIYGILRRQGAAAGAALRAQRFILDSNFNLQRMKYKMKEAKGGDLTADEVKKLEKLVAEYKYAVAILDRELARKNEELAKTVEDNIKLKAEADFAQTVEEVLEAQKKNIKFSDKVLKKTGERAAKARERMRARSGRLNTIGADPTILIDLAEIGADYIARGVVTASEWSSAMIKEFGAKIEPYLTEIRQKSWAIVRDDQKTMAPEDQAVKGEGKAKGEVKEETFPEQVKRLMKEQVEEGVTNVYEAAKNVLDIVKAENPDMTMVPMLDAYGDYGVPIKKSKSEAKKTLRHWRAKAQRLSKIARLAKGTMFDKRGSSFEKPDLETRTLEKKIKSLLKSEGLEVVNAEKQGATALAGMKTRALNTIEELEKALETKTKLLKDKKAAPSDAELVLLKEKIEGLKAQYAEMFPKEGVSDEQRLDIATRGAERSLKAQEEKLKDAKKGIWNRKKSDPVKPNQRITQIKAERDAIKAEIQKLKDIAFPKKSPEEVAIEQWTKRTYRTIKEKEKRIRQGNFEPVSRKTVDISKDLEALKAQAAVEEVAIRYAQAKEDMRWSTLDFWERLNERRKAIWNATRNIAYSADDSFLGRQGWFFMMTHPTKWAKAGARSVQAFSKEKTLAFGEEFRTDELNGIFSKMGLDLTHIDKAGEVMNLDDMSDLDITKNVPVIGTIVDASGRAFAVSSNDMRRGFAKLLLESTKMGREILANPKQDLSVKQKKFLKNIGYGVNTLTGRGEIKRGAGLSKPFGAPRFVVATFDAVLHKPILVPLLKGDIQTARVIAKEYIKVEAILLLIAMLSKAFLPEEDQIELDPRSTDFMRVPLPFIKNYKFPLLGPYASVIKFLAQHISGQRKTASGEIINMRESWLPFATKEQRKNKVPFRDDEASEIMNFIRQKLHPGINGSIAIVTGWNFYGERQSRLRSLVEMFTPITPRQAIDAAETSGIAAGVAVALSETFGGTTSVDYKSFAYKATKAYRAINYYEGVSPEKRAMVWSEIQGYWTEAKRAYSDLDYKGEATQDDQERLEKIQKKFDEAQSLPRN